MMEDITFSNWYHGRKHFDFCFINEAYNEACLPLDQMQRLKRAHNLSPFYCIMKEWTSVSFADMVKMTGKKGKSSQWVSFYFNCETAAGKVNEKKKYNKLK